jgi:acyl-CoA synthetase (AMP-forming)/AMP-acid ligase II
VPPHQRLLEHKGVKGIQRLERGKLRVWRRAGAPLGLDLGSGSRTNWNSAVEQLQRITSSFARPNRVSVQNTPLRRDRSAPFFPGIEHRSDRQGKKVAIGEVGELHVRGPNVMLGYYRAPEQTAAAIDEPG